MINKGDGSKATNKTLWISSCLMTELARTLVFLVHGQQTTSYDAKNDSTYDETAVSWMIRDWLLVINHQRKTALDQPLLPYMIDRNHYWPLWFVSFLICLSWIQPTLEPDILINFYYSNWHRINLESAARNCLDHRNGTWGCLSPNCRPRRGWMEMLGSRAAHIGARGRWNIGMQPVATSRNSSGFKSG